MSEQEPAAASAGIPNALSPSGATSPGSAAADTLWEAQTGPPDTAGQPERPPEAVPGQPPGSDVEPVPSPGDVPGASLPAVAATEGPSPRTGVHAGEKAPDSAATIASPAAYVALSAPGHPDGEVDTRAR